MAKNELPIVDELVLIDDSATVISSEFDTPQGEGGNGDA